MNSFEILFFFDNPKKAIVEIKIEKPSESLERNKTFHWLMFDKQLHTLEKLDYISMCRFPDYEKREFNQGSLKFDHINGQYIYNDSLVCVKLDTLQPFEASDLIINAITGYFKNKN